jgi:hypothetical protein
VERFWRVSRRLRLKAHPDACQDALKAVLESAQPICCVRYLFKQVQLQPPASSAGFFVSTNILVCALPRTRQAIVGLKGTDAPVNFKDILHSR